MQTEPDTYTRQKYLLEGFLFPIRGYNENLNRCFYVMAVEKMCVSHVFLVKAGLENEMLIYSLARERPGKEYPVPCTMCTGAWKIMTGLHIMVVI